MIDLYTWTTPNGRKVSIMLEELGVPYRAHAVDIGKDAQFAPDFLAISPNNKIPAITDDDTGQTLMESGAILLYLARKYGKRFRDFKGSEIEVTGARKVKSFQEVRAIAKLRGQSPFTVAFMVSDRSGRDKFFDLLIEGVSLLKAERSEVGAMLDRVGGNVDNLVTELKRQG